jgi:hypothetical protein
MQRKSFEVEGNVTEEQIIKVLQGKFPDTNITFKGYYQQVQHPSTSIQNASISSSLEDQDEIMKQECVTKYGVKGYIARHLALNPPPLLLSFPGSGNTWARLLIEVATGINTGDIYTDHSLKSVFAGEKSCGKRVSVGMLTESEVIDSIRMYISNHLLLCLLSYSFFLLNIHIRICTQLSSTLKI